MSIQERIKQVRLESGLTQEEFSASIGLKRQNYAQLETGKQLPSFEVITAIVKIYNKSYSWLIEGKESKVLSQNLTPQEQERGKNTGKERGKVQISIAKQSKGSVNYGLGPVIEQVVDTTGMKIIPVLDIKAAAGTGYLNTESFDESQVLRLPATMVKSGNHICIRVKGPSMAPTFQDGGYLIIRLLERSEWINLRNEYCFVIVDMEGKTFIKRIKNRFSGETGGFITCMSDNPDKTSHPNFNLHPEEINLIWYVEWYFTAKMPNIHDQYYSRLGNLEDKMEIMAEEFRSLKKQLV
jgi:phage repressor protein C with HTH and peptisase S24 domain